jgi:hypothetical protein
MLQHITLQITKFHGIDEEKSILAKVKVRLTSNEWTYIGVCEADGSRVVLTYTGYRIKALFLYLMFVQNEQHEGAQRTAQLIF